MDASTVADAAADAVGVSTCFFLMMLHSLSIRRKVLRGKPLKLSLQYYVEFSSNFFSSRFVASCAEVRTYRWQVVFCVFVCHNE